MDNTLWEMVDMVARYRWLLVSLAVLFGFRLTISIWQGIPRFIVPRSGGEQGRELEYPKRDIPHRPGSFGKGPK